MGGAVRGIAEGAYSGLEEVHLCCFTSVEVQTLTEVLKAERPALEGLVSRALSSDGQLGAGIASGCPGEGLEQPLEVTSAAAPLVQKQGGRSSCSCCAGIRC